MTGLLYLKTGESRFFRLATRSVTCTRVRPSFSPRSHSRHLPFTLHSLCSRTAPKPLTPFFTVQQVQRFGSMTALSGFKVQTCPVIKYKSVRYLSATRNRFPVFKYTEFTSNGDRPAFKYSSTAGVAGP